MNEPEQSKVNDAWQILWFILHTAVVYGIVKYIPLPLAAWVRNTFLHPTQTYSLSGGFDFFFSHLLAITFIPASLIGMINVRFQHKAAQFVWILPTAILVYKIATFNDGSVLQGQVGGPWHQYFGTTFSVPEATNWREYWNIVSSPEMLRGRAQLEFTAPFYAGIGYSLAALVSRHVRATTPVAEHKEANAIVK